MVDNTSKSAVMGVGGADSALRQEESAPAAPSSEPQAEGAASAYAGSPILFRLLRLFSKIMQ